MRDIVNAIRRAVEAVLPWYDPQRETAKDRIVERHVKAAETQADRLGSYQRTSHR